MKLSQHIKACATKARHRTRSHAWNSVFWVFVQRGVYCTVYKCPACKGFHLTSKRASPSVPPEYMKNLEGWFGCKLPISVIFLDIDGVMNCYHEGEKWADRKDRVPMIHNDIVRRFNRILNETGAYVVLSSTWRKDPDWLETMVKAGMPRDAFLGRTISLSKERFEWSEKNPGKGMVEFMERGKEIQAWLDEHPEVTRYCILDDDSDMMSHQKHFKTSIFTGGLTQSIADQVINYLNAPVDILRIAGVQ